MIWMLGIDSKCVEWGLRILKTCQFLSILMGKMMVSQELLGKPHFETSSWNYSYLYIYSLLHTYTYTKHSRHARVLMSIVWVAAGPWKISRTKAVARLGKTTGAHKMGHAAVENAAPIGLTIHGFSSFMVFFLVTCWRFPTFWFSKFAKDLHGFVQRWRHHFWFGFHMFPSNWLWFPTLVSIFVGFPTDFGSQHWFPTTLDNLPNIFIWLVVSNKHDFYFP